MKAIIVDDEPKAIILLKSYLEHFSKIELLATFRNGLKAIEFLNQEKVDLIFLDINMPHLSGLSLSKMLSKETKIIFTTAYAEHAVESYEVNAIDYLLKPISLARFTQAITKVLSLAEGFSSSEPDTIILLKSGSRNYRITLADILFLQKDGNYMTYYVGDQKVLTRESVAEALAKLPAQFLQCHKSYIVNSRKVHFFDKDELSVGQHKIPIGKAYKAEFLASMRGA